MDIKLCIVSLNNTCLDTVKQTQFCGFTTREFSVINSLVIVLILCRELSRYSWNM